MPRKIKVLEFLPGLNYGGAQAMIINLCRNIDYDQVQCDFIIDHSGLLEMKDLVESFGAQVFTAPQFKGTNLKEITAFWDRFFEEHDYDIIHSHVRSYAFIVMRIAKRHGMKTIIHSHNTSNGKGFRSTVQTIMQYPLRNTADYFFGCSREAGEWLFGKKVTKGDRFYVINNGIDTDRFTYDVRIREQYRKGFGFKDEKVFIQVGRMSAQKNYLFTLDVFKKYLEYDGNAKLVIVGDGEQEQAIRDRIRQLKLEDNVIILQRRDDVHALLQMADVFLMPSLYEGLSVACIEAESSGIICLCSDRVDQNVNVTGQCRFIPLDTDLWIEEMKRTDEDRHAYRKEIADAGFDAKVNAEWMTEFYRSIV